ncbi:unnamed protein product [Mucor hiemalis]
MESTNDIVPITGKEENVAFFKKRGGNKNIRKRKAPAKVQSDSDDDDSDDDNVVSEVRRIKKGGSDDEEEEEDLIGIQYTADRSTNLQKSDATRYDTEWELEKKDLDKKGKEAPKKDVMNAKMSVGPQRAPANLRVTQRFDYQPDIYADDSDDELPFACLICREEFKNPVVTRCNHYFCESCAIKNYKKSPKCFACGSPTQGVFNTAKKLLEKLEEKKKRMDEGKDSDAESTGFIEGLETKQENDDDDEDDE